MNEDKEIRVERKAEIHMGKSFIPTVHSTVSFISGLLPATVTTSLPKHRSVGVNGLDLNQGEMPWYHYFVCMFAYLLKCMKEK